MVNVTSPIDTVNMIEKYPEDFPKFVNRILQSADVNIQQRRYKKAEPQQLNEVTQGLLSLLPTIATTNNPEEFSPIQQYFVHSVYDQS
jgi:hypothetical protein